MGVTIDISGDEVIQIEEETNGVNDEVLQRNHYYSFGMRVDMPLFNMGDDPKNKYLYNGKELQTDFDLGLHDYGARYYDATIGRLTTIDRFAEKYSNAAPYHYALNNPISLIDINGDSTWIKETANSYTINTTIEFTGNALYNRKGEKRKNAEARVNAVVEEIKSKWEGVEHNGKTVHVNIVTILSKSGNTKSSYDQIEFTKGSARSFIQVYDKKGNIVPHGLPTSKFIKEVIAGKNDYNIKGTFYTNTRSGTFAHEYGHMIGYWQEDYRPPHKGELNPWNRNNLPVHPDKKDSIMFHPYGSVMPHVLKFIFGINKPTK